MCEGKFTPETSLYQQFLHIFFLLSSNCPTYDPFQYICLFNEILHSCLTIQVIQGFIFNEHSFERVQVI